MTRPAAWLDHAATSVFAAIDERVRTQGRADVVRLHQGRTYFAPCVEPGAWTRQEFPLLAHEHAPPGGMPRLRENAADYLKNRHGRVADPADVVITNGATHGVFTVFNTILEPGDEVLVLSPQWLFAVGLVHAARGRAIEVPVFQQLSADPSFDLAATLTAAVTPRTRALYLNTPNNPTGVRLGVPRLRVLAELAERHGLWLVADNAYENYDFTEDGFVDVATVDLAAERTFSVYTLSKTFAIPGHRVGYVAAPPGWGEPLATAGLYSIYSLATTSQRAASAALATPAAELDERRRLAADAWRSTHDLLEVPHTPAAGGLYTFLDLSACPEGTPRFIERCIDAGVTLAPGTAFGSGYGAYARLCFTAAEPASLQRALHTINSVYRRSKR